MKAVARGALSEIRKHLIYIFTVFVAFLILSLAFCERILKIVPGVKLTVLGTSDVIHIYFLIAGIVAIGFTLPFASWQIWLYLLPGLSLREKKETLRFIPWIVLMFILGISFGWFIIFLALFSFLMKLGAQQFNMMITAQSYFGLISNIVLPFGFFFEMPIVIMFLTRLGIIVPEKLVKMRKYAYLVDNNCIYDFST